MADLSATITVRKGTYAQLNANKSKLKQGELAYCTDTKQLYIGTGTDIELVNDRVDLSGYALKSEIPTVPTSEISANTNARHTHSNKAILDAITKAPVTEHQQLKTINGQSIVGSGDIVIQGGSGNTSSSDNALNGKKILIAGDSLNAGEGWSGGFANLIAEEYPNAIINNVSVSGTTLQGGQIFFELVSAVEQNFVPDFLLIDGGGNDLMNNKPMGNLAEDYYVDFDHATTLSALETIFYQVHQLWPSCKIVFFTAWKLAMSNYAQRTFWSTIAEECNKYGVTFVDFFNGSNVIPTDSAYHYDIVHPNEAGYRKLWTRLKQALVNDVRDYSTDVNSLIDAKLTPLETLSANLLEVI